VWTRAEPLYAQARVAFIAAGDERNALYAEVSRLRGQLPTSAVPEVSERLSEYLDNPLVQSDDRLRLRVLVIKGETDEDLDPSLSQRSWTEALALTQKLNRAARPAQDHRDRHEHVEPDRAQRLGDRRLGGRSGSCGAAGSATWW
jgi:hypothetical protein